MLKFASKPGLIARSEGELDMSKELQLSPNFLPTVGSIETYISRVNAIPVLEKEEEFDLATRLQREGDLLAAQTLILSHLRYVARIAKGYMGYGLAFADLMQEGTIGLMKAVKRFNPDVGVRLVSFAVHWIKAEIHDYVIRNWRIVKVATTKAQRKLFFNLRRHKTTLSWFTKEEAEAVAKDLNVSVKEVLEMEQRMLASSDVTFERPSDEDELETTFAPIQYLEAPNADPERALETESSSEDLNERMQMGLETLDERSRDIIQKRWLHAKKSTLKDLAEYHKVSIERIRQIEQAAFLKIRGLLEGVTIEH